MKELYVSVSGAMARERELAIASHNLANARSVGFKKSTPAFELRLPETDFEALRNTVDPELELPYPRQSVAEERLYVGLAESRIDFRAGPLRQTGRPLDVALETTGQDGGVAFFAVNVEGEEYYTRMGNFFLNGARELVTADGHAVLNDRRRAVQLGGEGVKIDAGGTITDVDGGSRQLAVAVFDNPLDLEPLGQGLYTIRAGGQEPRDKRTEDGVQVRQGSLEESNVNVVEELVRMIQLQRAYTTHQKAIQSMDEASSRTIASVMDS